MNLNKIIVLIITSMLSAFIKLDLAIILVKYTKKIKYNRLIVSTIILTIYIFLSYLITDNAIKVIIDFIVVIYCIEYILEFNKNYFIKSVITAFVVWSVMLIIDIFFQ